MNDHLEAALTEAIEKSESGGDTEGAEIIKNILKKIQ